VAVVTLLHGSYSQCLLHSASDPDDSGTLACDQIPPNGFNIDFYCNHTLNALYNQEQAMADSSLRQQIFEQINLILLIQFPFIVIVSPVHPSLVHTGAHNYQPSDALETANIWNGGEIMGSVKRICSSSREGYPRNGSVYPFSRLGNALIKC
jgi:ABC-type transport system substrate-binding protein